MEAIGLARAHHPDLILMDIQLPEVSGLVVTKWLKEDDDLQSIPVIAVTAFAMNVPGSRRVFVVHGHDRDIRKAVVDLLTRLDLIPIVIADKVAKGKTK